jgi:putative transposase
VLERIWKEGLLEYDAKKGVEWEWQSMDTVMTKAPLGGKSTRPNPTDRAKSGTKRSVLVEGKGVPLAVTVAGANRHDMKLVGPTLKNIVRPKPTKKHPQNMCMDKEFDFLEVDELVDEQIQAPSDQMGEEGKLSGDATPHLCLDNVPASWNYRISPK